MENLRQQQCIWYMEPLGDSPLDHLVPWLYGAAVFTLEALSLAVMEEAPLRVLSDDFRHQKAACDHCVSIRTGKVLKGEVDLCKIYTSKSMMLILSKLAMSVIFMDCMLQCL